jgi:tyrosine-protein kinase Etk/Wzc
MKAPRSVVGTLAVLPVLIRPWPRRAIFGVLAAICAVLTLFPEQYRAAISLTPSDPEALGLSSTLSQFGAVGNVFGSQAAVEVSLKVARGEYVRSIVAKQLDLARKLGKSRTQTQRWLKDEVDIRVLRGGIIQFEIYEHDPEFARSIVAAYGGAVREQLAIISRRQTVQKRQILEELLAKASDRLSIAQAAYDGFRLKTRYSSPQAAIFAAGDRIPELEAIIRAKEVDFNAISQFATGENIRIRQAKAEIASLQAQLEAARSTSPAEKSSVGDVVLQSTEVQRLKRDLAVAQGLYDNYKRFYSGTSVEELTSSANIRILEPAYVDSSRQFNVLPLALGLIVLLLGLAIEFYLLRPPLEMRERA